jgi:hypothetical protein
MSQRQANSGTDRCRVGVDQAHGGYDGKRSDRKRAAGGGTIGTPSSGNSIGP